VFVNVDARLTIDTGVPVVSVPPDGVDGEYELQPTARPTNPARMPNRNLIFISIRRDHRKGVAMSPRGAIIGIRGQNPDPQRFLCLRKFEFLSVGVTRR
jgi:hypothetical protein